MKSQLLMMMGCLALGVGSALLTQWLHPLSPVDLPCTMVVACAIGVVFFLWGLFREEWEERNARP